jgi:hypothetical protein
MARLYHVRIGYGSLCQIWSWLFTLDQVRPCKLSLGQVGACYVRLDKVMSGSFRLVHIRFG